MKCTELNRERPEECCFSRGHRRPSVVLRGAWGQHRANRLQGRSGPRFAHSDGSQHRREDFPAPRSHSQQRSRLSR